MYNLALQTEKITRKPHIPRLEENNVRQGFFEQWEFEAVLAKLPECLRPPFTLAYHTGWRVLSEVLRLTWQQIDLDAGTIRLEVGTTKNKDGRLIFLTRLGRLFAVVGRCNRNSLLKPRVERNVLGESSLNLTNR
jgi:integrase